LAGILEPYEPTGGAPEPPEETIGRQLEKALRTLASQPFTATITGQAGAWTETVAGTETIALPPGARLRIRLLTVPGRAIVQEGTCIDAVFGGIGTGDVTPFVVLSLTYDDGAMVVERATVVRAELIGDPPARLDEIIARQVDTPEKFLRFLALLLGLADDPFAMVASANSGGGGSWRWGPFGGTGLFELVVRAVADRPQAIDDLDRLIARLEATDRGRQALPDGFDALWQTIRRAHARVGAAR
jgi:hypothetical protein